MVRPVLDFNRDDDRISDYGPGFVEVGGVRFEASCLIGAGGIRAWGPDAVESLDLGHVEALTSLGSEVLLLGTGARHHLLRPKQLAPCLQAGLAVEVMSTPAAIRTYNVLRSEGRRVVAALIIEPALDPAPGPLNREAP